MTPPTRVQAATGSLQSSVGLTILYQQQYVANTQPQTNMPVNRADAVVSLEAVASSAATLQTPCRGTARQTQQDLNTMQGHLIQYLEHALASWGLVDCTLRISHACKPQVRCLHYILQPAMYRPHAKLAKQSAQ